MIKKEKGKIERGPVSSMKDNGSQSIGDPPSRFWLSGLYVLIQVSQSLEEIGNLTGARTSQPEHHVLGKSWVRVPPM